MIDMDVWIVTYEDPENNRSGIHGVFQSERDANVARDMCNRSSNQVFRAQQWLVVNPISNHIKNIQKHFTNKE